MPKLATGRFVPKYRDMRNNPYESKHVPVTGDRRRYLTVIQSGAAVETGGRCHGTIRHVLDLPASNDQPRIVVTGDDDCSLHLLRWNALRILDHKIDALNGVPSWSLTRAERSWGLFQAVTMVFQLSYSLPWHKFQNPNHLGVRIVSDETQKDPGSDSQDNETVESGQLILIRVCMTLILLQGTRRGTNCLPFENGAGPSSSGTTTDQDGEQDHKAYHRSTGWTEDLPGIQDVSDATRGAPAFRYQSNVTVDNKRNEAEPIRAPTAHRVGVTVILGNGIQESKRNGWSDSFRTAKPKQIERFLRPEHSMVAMSTAATRKDRYMSRDSSLNSSSITSKEEGRNYELLLRTTTALPPSHRPQVPIRMDRQDTTGGGLMRITYGHSRTPRPGIELSIRKYWPSEDYFDGSQRRSQTMIKDILLGRRMMLWNCFQSDPGGDVTTPPHMQSNEFLKFPHPAIRPERKYGPGRGIGDNRTDDESQELWWRVYRYTRICNPGVNMGPNMKSCPHAPSLSLVLFVCRNQGSQTLDALEPRPQDCKARDDRAKLLIAVQFGMTAGPRRKTPEDVKPSRSRTKPIKRTALGNDSKSNERCRGRVSFHQRFSDAYFVVSFYKMIQNRGTILSDFENIDTGLHRDRTRIWEGNIVNLVFETVIEYRTPRCTYVPLDTFVSGLNELTPRELTSALNEHKLEFTDSMFDTDVGEPPKDMPKPSGSVSRPDQPVIGMAKYWHSVKITNGVERN
ncbi:hypothetical protein BS47DRAFT_1402739 [Hydnum rufescens UP504]|uniref:Uncharacterized protein n=1 Tax=Hydnum rufescens UP504 TaxID=1448309 RepID=A0A9P6ACA7_9AGAM|nr:hypothetical protein BS47DRAFT_1402739 [Hydnum rufescens UP504]